MSIFSELKFNVSQNVFLELFKNPDTGFGYKASIDKNELNELQIETFDYLIRCQKKKLLGAVNMVFTTDAIGEIQSLSRRVEGIQFKNNLYIIKNTY